MHFFDNWSNLVLVSGLQTNERWADWSPEGKSTDVTTQGCPLVWSRVSDKLMWLRLEWLTRMNQRLKELNITSCVWWESQACETTCHFSCFCSSCFIVCGFTLIHDWQTWVVHTVTALAILLFWGLVQGCRQSLFTGKYCCATVEYYW